MFKNKITVRVHTRFRALRADHGTPFLQKCRRAREILTEVYQDRELCITENLIRRSDYLRGRSPWKADEYYTEMFELGLIDSRLEAMISGSEPAWEPIPVTAREPDAPAAVPAQDQAQVPDDSPERLPDERPLQAGPEPGEFPPEAEEARETEAART